MSDTKPSYVVEPGDPFGKEVGFTKARFMGYISKVDGVVWISAIISKKPGRGNFSQLVKAIEAKGYTVKVPTPFPHMVAILKHWGFRQTFEWAEEMGEDVEVWVR